MVVPVFRVLDVFVLSDSVVMNVTHRYQHRAQVAIVSMAEHACNWRIEQLYVYVLFHLQECGVILLCHYAYRIHVYSMVPVYLVVRLDIYVGAHQILQVLSVI